MIILIMISKINNVTLGYNFEIWHFTSYYYGAKTHSFIHVPASRKNPL